MLKMRMVRMWLITMRLSMRRLIAIAIAIVIAIATMPTLMVTIVGRRIFTVMRIRVYHNFVPCAPNV